MEAAQVGGGVEDVGGAQGVLQADLPLGPVVVGLLAADDQQVRNVLDVVGQEEVAQTSDTDTYCVYIAQTVLLLTLHNFQSLLLLEKLL